MNRTTNSSRRLQIGVRSILTLSLSSHSCPRLLTTLDLDVLVSVAERVVVSVLPLCRILSYVTLALCRDIAVSN